MFTLTTLKDNAVPTVFSFLTPAKHRKFSETRASKAKQHAIMNELILVILILCNNPACFGTFLSTYFTLVENSNFFTLAINIYRIQNSPAVKKVCGPEVGHCGCEI